MHPNNTHQDQPQRLQVPPDYGPAPPYPAYNQQSYPVPAWPYGTQNLGFEPPQGVDSRPLEVLPPHLRPPPPPYCPEVNSAPMIHVYPPMEYHEPEYIPDRSPCQRNMTNCAMFLFFFIGFFVFLNVLRIFFTAMSRR